MAKFQFLAGQGEPYGNKDHRFFIYIARQEAGNPFTHHNDLNKESLLES